LTKRKKKFFTDDSFNGLHSKKAAREKPKDAGALMFCIFIDPSRGTRIL
jgi:hypothetical protein